MTTATLRNLGTLDDYTHRVNDSRRTQVAPQFNSFVNPPLRSEAFLSLPPEPAGTTITGGVLHLVRQSHYAMPGGPPSRIVVEVVDIGEGVDAADVSRLRRGVQIGAGTMWSAQDGPTPAPSKDAPLTVALQPFEVGVQQALRLTLEVDGDPQSSWYAAGFVADRVTMDYTAQVIVPAEPAADPFVAMLMQFGLSAEQAAQLVAAIRAGVV